MKTGVLLVVILALIFLVGFLLGRGFLTTDAGTQIRYIAQQEERIIRQYSLVHDSTYTFDMHEPFYAVTVQCPLIAGDVIEVKASGKGVWDDGAKNQEYVHATPSGVGYDVKFIDREKHPDEFKLKNAPVASLIGVIGDKVRWDQNAVAHIDQSTDHFLIGEERIFETPRGGSLFLAMNERWTTPANWERDNFGAWTVHVKVRRALH